MIGDGKPLKVRVEFSLEDPLGGVQVNQFVFVICAGLYKVSSRPPPPGAGEGKEMKSDGRISTPLHLCMSICIIIM